MDFTFVIFLYLSPEIRLLRLRQREHQLYGARILDGGDMEKDHKDFMKWTAGYDDGSSEGTNTLPKHLDFISSVKCPILKLEQPLSTGDQIALVLNSSLDFDFFNAHES